MCSVFFYYKGTQHEMPPGIHELAYLIIELQEQENETYEITTI